MTEDYISGEKFKQLCDFDFKSPDFNFINNLLSDDKKGKYVVYSDSENYVDALSFIHNNSPKKFVLVTHNGDTEIKPTGLPHNLVHWFAQNLNFKNPKVSPVPIGLENHHWHPTKIPEMLCMPESQKRINKSFCQYNPGTYPKERKTLVSDLWASNIEVDWYPSINGQNFSQYLFNLKIYKYCFCPRGNGIDTHRIWEALYMGCVPIVKNHITHQFEDCDLPILFIDDWTEFNYQEPNGNFDSEILTMTYWKNKIYGKIND